MNNTETTEITAKNPKVKNRREWVKNVIIIFLIIMVILTFFSNTIMNWSLAEVSVVSMSRDSVSKKYQLDIMVEANKNYTLTADESRDIKRVAVKKGQEVKEGQVLFYLKEVKDSEEAKALQEQIDTENLAYEKSLMKVADDYFDLNAAIIQARETLDQKIQQKNQSYSTDAPVDNSLRIADLTARKSMMESDIESLASQTYSALSSDMYRAIENELNAFNNAKTESINAQADLSQIKSQYQGGSIDSDITAGQRNVDRLETELSRLIQDNSSEREIEDKHTEIKYAKEDLNNLISLRDKINTASFAASEKDNALTSAQSALDLKAQQTKSSLQTQLTSVTNELNSLSSDSSGMSQEMPGSSGIDYDSEISQARLALNTATHALEAKIKEDKVLNAQTALEIEAQKKKIDKLQADLDEMLTKEKSTEIISPVEGVVSEISVTAGVTVAQSDQLMVINISDDGFTAKADISMEQSKSVKKGTEANVITPGFEDTSVKVRSVVKGKEDPTKLTVTFSVDGINMSEGQNLKLEIGESSQSYDMVLPKNAVKKDTSGSFVYSVKSKSTPLGNRYIVKKVNVTVIAEDDKQCAVNGEFGDSADYVITASSKPFSAGDQVRLAEG
ncbi:MAG: biotin/lipoyl-binding protein [Oscillospiraceae bacterium]|nr:biotin/lipoyl-binding protein [Oscillospiraceae bacterium]